MTASCRLFESLQTGTVICDDLIECLATLTSESHAGAKQDDIYYTLLWERMCLSKARKHVAFAAVSLERKQLILFQYIMSIQT